MMDNALFLRQYRAVREYAGLVNRDSKGLIQVTGPDRLSFLHALLSNDVTGLPVDGFCHAALLTARGRLLADLWVYHLADFVLIEAERSRIPTLLEALERYIIMDDVKLEDISDQWGQSSLQGPLSGKLIEGWLGVAPSDEQLLQRFEVSGISGLIARRPGLADLGFELFVPRMDRAALEQQIKDEAKRRGMEIEEIGEEAEECLRLEQGIPRFGVDMDETTIPLEVGLTDAISYSKGCYVGQEVVAKATHVGGVPRLLSRLRIESSEIPPVGAPILDSEDREVGRVTSSTFSPALGTAIGLGLVRRQLAEPGYRLWIRQADSSKLPAVVVSDFSASAV